MHTAPLSFIEHTITQQMPNLLALTTKKKKKKKKIKGTNNSTEKCGIDLNKISQNRKLK
jgi:hypothetical protein